MPVEWLELQHECLELQEKITFKWQPKLDHWGLWAYLADGRPMCLEVTFV